MGSCSLMPQSYVLLSEFPRPALPFRCRSVAFLLPVCGVSVPGPSVFRPRSAFPPGTCDAFWPLVRSGVPGPPPHFPRSVTSLSPVCDLSVAGLWRFCLRSVAFPLQVRIFPWDLRHFLASGALCRRRSPHISRTCDTSVRDLRRFLGSGALCRPRSPHISRTCDTPAQDLRQNNKTTKPPFAIPRKMANLAEKGQAC